MTRSKDVDLQKRKTGRTVFLIYVVGGQGAGKTAFLQSFLNKDINENKDLQNISQYAINSVQLRKQE